MNGAGNIEFDDSTAGVCARRQGPREQVAQLLTQPPGQQSLEESEV